MKILVLKHKWKIVVRSDKAHNRRYPETHAIAVLDDRKIHVRRSSLDKVSIIHELIHAYQHELSFWELMLDEDQIDEWFAELFAKYGEQIISDANKIISIFNKKFQGRKNGQGRPI
jgi:hypothetical protein